MKFTPISRRGFLGTSFVLSSIPSVLWAGSASHSSEVVLRCAVMSDVHFKTNPNCAERQRLEKTLKFMESYAHFDALVVAGDMTDHGHASELTLFRDSLFGHLPKGTQAILCMGNHEFYGGQAHKDVGGSRKHWEGIFSRAANTHTVVNGFHFIGISPDAGTCRNGDYAKSLEWLRKELDAAVKDDSKRPIFVFQHYHITDTVYGACNGDPWGTNDLRPVLDEYPQVINFSGHSHYPSNDPRSAWQGKFTAFGTSTLSYYEMAGGIYEKFPKGYRDGAQVYFMEVFRDNAVHLKIYDPITSTFYDTEYLVAEPGAAEKYCYTDARKDTSAAPCWKVPAEAQKVSVSDISSWSAKLTFPQAYHETCPASFIGSYQIRVEGKKTGSNEPWTLACERNPWSDYFYRSQTGEKTAVLEELEPGFDWRVTIRARSVFEKLSEKALTAEFQTPEDPDAKAQDRSAPNPKADVLNFFVSKDGKAQNDPFLKTFPHELKSSGSPKLTPGWAEFNGIEDRFYVPFTAGAYGRMKRQITMGTRFSFDGFQGKKREDIFANTESGGTAFELNHEKKVLEFWCHVSGRYQIISAPIQPGTHTVFGTYDGKNVTLWIDGVQAAQTKASGPLTYTSNNSARAYCIGCDVANGGRGSTYFKGKVQFAKIFNWALNEEQIKNLTKAE